jgi:hypothetical protein
MSEDRLVRRVRWACWLSLVSLAFMVWALVHPRPIPVIAAMSVGQGLGTLALVLYGWAVAIDLRRRKVLPGRGSSLPPD